MSCDLKGSCDPKSIFSKVVILKELNLKGSKIRFVLLYLNGFQNNGKFTFPMSCDLEGSCGPKIDIFKYCKFVGSKPAVVRKFSLCNLSLIVSEKNAILMFF